SKVLMAIACALVLIALPLYSFVDSDGARTLIAGVVAIFWAAIVVGMVVKLIRSRRGTKIRSAVSPLVGAADAYQSLLLGRPTMDESTIEAADHVAADKFTSGP
ncbi:hypothetical protein, partial [Arthrobacter sp.]|uniref:hypothetical protein n=1 Tax=Arthrobacter sp. TaxID=1667 RepID=UPI0026DFDD8A